MEQKKNKHLRLVKSSKGFVNSLRQWIDSYRTGDRKRLLVTLICVTVVVIGAILLVASLTYTKSHLVKSYTGSGLTDSNYVQFGTDVLKYNSDGVSLVSQKGKEKWNQSSQFNNPIVATSEDCAVVCDRGGTSLQTFDKDGLRGEITTTLPIEKVSVSNQGIVAVVLKNEMTPEILCYDVTGNILVEHKVSVSKSGYPTSLSISPNGYLLMVTYLKIEQNKLVSHISYYNFDKVGEDKIDHQVVSENVKGEIQASSFFMGEDVSAVIGENTLRVYKGADIPQLQKKINIKKEIISIAHSRYYIVMLLQNNGEKGYELRAYNRRGRKIMSTTVDSTYNHMKISGREILLYDGRNCAIYKISGHLKFLGRLDVAVEEMFPASGLNKYIVMNTNGMNIIRLDK